METIYKTNYSPRPDVYLIGDQIKKASIYKTKNPGIGMLSNTGSRYGERGGRRKFKEEEYDLYETGRIIDTEAFVSRAFTKKNTLIFRDGYEIRSDHEENLKYIKNRIKEIEYVSGIKFPDLLREYSYNLIAFHNPYIVKVRKLEASSGNRRKWRGLTEVDPVAAYYCLPPEAMQKAPDKSGEPVKYRQYISGSKYREFMKRNIIYTPYDKRSGYSMGTPPLEPVKDDILVLRRIEESVETLIHKSLFPVIHVKVGTEKYPAKVLASGQTEVDAAALLLENIDDNGGIVTSERVEMKAFGAESLALRVESYLQHFKYRVFAGLGMSAMDFGAGDCHDSETEFLTDKGWMKPEKIDIRKRTLGTINPDTQELEFQKPIREIRQAYSGEMIEFLGMDTDMKVTPNHDMHIYNLKEKAYQIVKADILASPDFPDQYKFLKAPEGNPMELPCISKFNIGRRNTTENRFSRPPEVLIDFKKNIKAIMFTIMFGRHKLMRPDSDTKSRATGDGSSYNGVVLEFSRRSVESVDRIVKAFAESEIHHRLYRCIHKKGHPPPLKEFSRIEILDKDMVAYFNNEIHTGRGKFSNVLPYNIISLGPHEKMLAVQAVTKMPRGYGRHKDMAWINVLNSELGNQFVTLFFECGVYSKRKNPKFAEDGSTVSDTDYTEGCLLWFNVDLQRKLSTRISSGFPSAEKTYRRVHYTGEIFCYEVENHLLVTRRNGRIGISGNSTGKATGEVLSASLRDSVVTYQTIIEEMVTDDIFTELLLESGRYEHPFDIPEEDAVTLVFSTVDTAEMIKKESHVLNMMTQGILMTNEARKEIGKKPLSEEEFSQLHSVKMKEMDAQRGIDVAEKMKKINPPDKGGVPDGKPKPAKVKQKGKDQDKKGKGSAKQTKSITSPKNQHSSTKDFYERLSEIIESDCSPKVKSVSAGIILDQMTASFITGGLLTDIDSLGEEASIFSKRAKDKILKIVGKTGESEAKNALINKILDNLFSCCQNIKI